MKKIFYSAIVFCFSEVLLFSSCKKGDMYQGDTPNASENRHPIANAGVDQTTALPKDSIVLDGTASFDEDGNISFYHWSKISGPESSAIMDSTSVQTLVKSLVEGIYEFELTVVDDGGLIAKDDVEITVYPAITTGCDTENRSRINATLTWIGTLSEPRIPYAAAAGSKIVFAGGGIINGQYYIVSPAIDIYDVSSGMWATASLGEGREGISAVSCENKIFFAGGGFFDRARNTINIFDASSGAWTAAGLSEPRSYLTAGVVGNKVLFAGGFLDDGPVSTRVDIYDLTTNTWSTAELSIPRCCLTSVTIGDKIYFAGGRDMWSSVESNSTRVDIYNSTTNSWSTGELKELAGPVSSVAVGDKIYWAGISRSQHKGEVEIWNTTTGEVTFNCLSYPRYAPSSLVKGNEIIFFSSSSEWNNEIDFANNLRSQFDIYNITTNQWSIGVLPQPVIAPGIVSVDNSIYVGGGRTGRYSCTDKVYLLNW